MGLFHVFCDLLIEQTWQGSTSLTEGLCSISRGFFFLLLNLKLFNITLTNSTTNLLTGVVVELGNVKGMLINQSLAAI